MRRWLAALVVAAAAWTATPGAQSAETIPPRLTDPEFWRLVSDLSERNGSFRSDNLLSNEIFYERALNRLTRMTRPGRAYIGVGPEQNFTYAAALKPSIAFIVDIRRGNLDLHLLYKAIFELSRDRVDFVAKLFSRPRPAGLDVGSTLFRLFDAVSATRSDDDEFRRNLAEVRDVLSARHGFDLAAEDLEQIEFLYRAFYTLGPSVRYSPFGVVGGTVQPTYAELMTATDDRGRMRSFLASEASFLVIKDLEARNLIVPVVGDFAGPKAIRAIGAYLKAHNARVSAFYVSNVEEYLREDRKWTAFCANVRELPLDASSTFIRMVSIREPHGSSTGLSTELKPMLTETQACRLPSAAR